MIVNRTEALDDCIEEITHREITLPKINDDVTNAFVRHHCNIVWKRLGEDHFCHANSYSAIAQSKYDSGPVQAVVVNPPTMSRIQYSRKYESRSRY